MPLLLRWWSLLLVTVVVAPMSMLLSMPTPASAWTTSTSTTATVEWIDLRLGASGSVSPPRSGHAAFVLNQKCYVFGGYAEDSVAVVATPDTLERYPTNDLWCLDTTTTTTTTTTATGSNNNTRVGWTRLRAGGEPRPRLAAAAVACRLDRDSDKTAGLILGGWDPRPAGTGGEILKDAVAFVPGSGCGSGDDCGDRDDDDDDDDDCGDGSASGSWAPLSTDFDLGQPTSRLCAVPLPNDGNNDGDVPSPRVLIHNHRCLDHVLILNAETKELTQQPVSGTVPSARGLHACVCLPGTASNRVVLFGGAAQTGSMSNEVFVLDTDTWVWEECKVVAASSDSDGDSDCDSDSDGDCDGDSDSDSDSDDVVPCPRASPCLVALDETTCLLFGGAAPSDETGLHGLNDVWLLEFEFEPVDKNSENENDKNKNKNKNKRSSCRWTKLSADGSTDAPPGRNAATLLPLPARPRMLSGSGTDDDDENSRYFLLTGGWYPFRKTYGDNFVLRVTYTK